MGKREKSERVHFCIPPSEFRIKAISLGMSEDIFCDLYSKQMLSKFTCASIKCPFKIKDAQNFTRRVFHPTIEEEKCDKEYCQELLNKGVDFKKLQEDLSFQFVFKDFLSLSKSSLNKKLEEIGKMLANLHKISIELGKPFDSGEVLGEYDKKFGGRNREMATYITNPIYFPPETCCYANPDEKIWPD